MSKSERIQSLAETDDDRVLLAKVFDRLSKAQLRCCPDATAFLTEREQALVKHLLQWEGIDNITFFGGYDTAERTIAVHVPEYLDEHEYLYASEGPLAAVRAEISGYDSVSHRDVLGALMGIGVRRDVIGDILIADSSCDILVLSEIAPYLVSQLTGFGRAKVRLSAVPLTTLHIPKQKLKTIRDTVSSLRIDSIVAAGFQIGRSKAADMIRAGRVEADHLAVTKADRTVSEGCVISVRGLGKMKLTAINGMTRKERISVTIDRFL